ncbi:mechanosensitive ion channel, partial [candidate division KSB1 bacterium]|nr:mechanosensitive ion channel [candidate division KSB1 bacterium]NIR71289.1 mechanosensitive ion channel [candidate division KSB1 bacterium]NIS24818.1 mechanosensitive ion channel [candidate division KSB1 bacterium]NIT71725.1 mechanosensitive ion channel [candidate division KSB1 bacterium]NIU25454.1 mechanosensitive ion channel [candidate division KSB1 bacterium]
MNKDTFKRLWRPFLLFLTFAGFTIVKRDLLLQFGTEAVDQSQKVIAYVVQIGIWLSAAHFLNRLALVFFWDGLVARTLGAPIPRLIKDIFTIVVYLIAITGIVGIVFQKSVTGFWATSGVVGVILGFALRNMILDVFTGLAINIDRPYKIGDWIKVHAANPEQNIVGKIMEFNWRTTRLKTQDDSVAVLPNSLLGTMMVTNFWGSGPESRFEITVCLDFSVPTERACRVLSAGAQAAVGQTGILEQPAPRVILSGTTSLGIEYKVRYWMSPWTDDITEGAGRSHVTTNILAHLKQAGITPAYPKQDLFHAKMPTRHLDSTSLEDRTKLLGQTELFKHLDTRELEELAANMKQHYYKRGEKLIRQGEAGDSMFILSEGLLHAFLNSENGQTEVRVGQIVP